MDNIYHDYWEQELMYQFITEDKCRKKAYDIGNYIVEYDDHYHCKKCVGDLFN